MVAHLECVVDSVDRTIRQVASESGAFVLRDATINLATSTSRCAYLLVDRHGVLVIHTEFWPKAIIRGSSRSAEWTARFSRTSRRRFRNPLAANARRVESVESALLAFGKRLPPEYFSDLVVIDAEDTSELTLRDRQRARLVNASDLKRALKARYDLAIHDGGLEPREVLEVFTLLKRGNGAEASVAPTPPATPPTPVEPPATPPKAAGPRPEPATPATPPKAAEPRPEPATPAEPARPAWQPLPAPKATPARQLPMTRPVAPSLAAAPLRTPASAASWTEHSFAPPVAPYVGSNHGSLRYPEQPRVRIRVPSKKSVILLAVLSAIVVWGSLFGGYARIVDRVQESLNTFSLQSRPVFGSKTAGADLQRAKEIFREREPEIYEVAEDLNFPTVTPVDDEVRYTWHYHDVSGTSRAYTIAFGLSGEFRTDRHH